jgi:tetratricopeptide (TPR) repeat protein
MGINSMNYSRYKEKLNLAANFEEEQNYLHAMQIYISIIKEDENHIESYLRLIKLLERTGRTDKAVNVVEKLVDLNSDNDYALLFASEFYMFYSEWKEAIKIISRLNPHDYPIVNYWLGLCHYNLKEFEAALIVLKNSYNKVEEEYKYQLILLLAKIEFELGDYSSAILYAEEYSQFNSGDWEVNLLLAKIYWQLDMLTNASQKIEKAFKKAKHNIEICETAVRIFFKIGEYVKAEKYIDQIIELRDEISAEVYFYIGSIAENKSEHDKAMHYYELALKIDPELNLAKNSLDNLLIAKSGVEKK